LENHAVEKTVAADTAKLSCAIDVRIGVEPQDIVQGTLPLDRVSALSRVRQNFWVALALTNAKEQNLTNGGSRH
jgi:hypothetical protein